jgi:hypothetical protein
MFRNRTPVLHLGFQRPGLGFRSSSCGAQRPDHDAPADSTTRSSAHYGMRWRAAPSMWPSRFASAQQTHDIRHESDGVRRDHLAAAVLLVPRWRGRIDNDVPPTRAGGRPQDWRRFMTTGSKSARSLDESEEMAVSHRSL